MLIGALIGGGGAVDGIDGELGDGEGEGADSETDSGVENSVFGFFNFTRVAGGGHILDAAIDNNDDGDETENTNDDFDDVANYCAG